MAAGSLALGSCGGGGGGSPTPTPGGGGGGSSITLTSPTSASVVENTSGTVYTATGSAGGGQAVSFALGTGSDSGVFTMTGGALRFKTTPDFEKPADGDKTNTYVVPFTANSGSRTANFSVTITVTNDKEGISVKRIATGFTNPVCVDFLVEEPAPTAGPQGRIAVGEKGGKIYKVDGGTGQRTQIADAFAGRSPGELIECKTLKRVRTFAFAGLYGAARESNGRVWMRRFDNGGTNGVSEAELLAAGTPATGLKLVYGPNDEFYMAVSDTDGSQAQNASSPLGKLFWLEQDNNDTGASVQPGEFHRRMIGDGIRDSGGGNFIGNSLLLTDRGGSVQHELGFFDAGSNALDFGWPSWEGTAPLVSSPPAAVVVPYLVYPVGTGKRQGTGVVSGWVYAGPASQLKNRYVFCDLNGTIWSLPVSTLNAGGRTVDDLEDRTADFEPDAGTINSPVGFAVDDRNRFFILDSDGELFRVDGV